MKNLICCFLSLMLILIACQQQEKEMVLLDKADSLMSTRPDEALRLLESTSIDKMQTPPARARYALLLTQAQDKNYVTPTSDSLIRIAVNYYDSIENNAAMQGKAHYYLGRIHQEIGNNPATVREYLIALPLVKQIKDYKLLSILQGNLGNVYFEQGLLDKADSLYVCEEELLKQEVDSAHLAMLLVQRADICIVKGAEFYPEAKKFLDHALSIAEKLNNPHIEITVLGSLRCLYSDMGEPAKAISYINRELRLQKDTTQRYGTYLSLSDAYSRNGQYDSAVYYAQKSILSPNYYTKADACIILEEASKQNGNLTEALQFKDKYVAYMDSAEQTKRTIEVLTAEKDILLQQEKQKYTNNLSSYFKYIYVCVLILIISTIFFLRKRFKYSQRTHQLKQEKDYLQNIISAQSIQMKKEMENKDGKIAELEKLCLEHKGDSAYLQQLNSCLEELLKEKQKLYCEMENLIAEKQRAIEHLKQQIQLSEETGKNIRLAEQLENIKKEKNYLFESLLTSQSKAYRNLLTLIQHNYQNPDAIQKLPNEVWEDLLSEIDQLTHGFVKRLTKNYERLLKEDVYFCCLVKIGIKIADIALAFGCTSNAAYKRRDAILKRMDNKSKLKFEILLEEI